MTAALSPLSAPPASSVLMITGRADFGGGPEHVFQLAAALAPSTTVYIASPREEPYWSRYQSLVGPDRLAEIPHRRFDLRTLFHLVRFIRAHDIGIVHAHGRAAGIYGRPAALLARAGSFYTPHGGTPVAGLRTFCYAAVDYLLSAFTRGIIAVSASEAQTLRAGCAAPSRIQVIPNGVAIPAAPAGPDLQRTRPLRVVHVTRFIYQKNPELLLEIIALLREAGMLHLFEFILLGEGPGRSNFEAEIARLGLGDHVKTVGAVRDPGSTLCAAFCFLSTSRWEGLPLALLEAMARGVPVIATNVMGNKDAVADGQTGFLYDAASPGAAVERLVQLAHDSNLWREMAQAARRRTEREFSAQAMAGATFGLYSRCGHPGNARDLRTGRESISRAKAPGMVHRPAIRTQRVAPL